MFHVLEYYKCIYRNSNWLMNKDTSLLLTISQKNKRKLYWYCHFFFTIFLDQTTIKLHNSSYSPKSKPFNYLSWRFICGEYEIHLNFNNNILLCAFETEQSWVKFHPYSSKISPSIWFCVKRYAWVICILPIVFEVKIEKNIKTRIKCALF